MEQKETILLLKNDQVTIDYSQNETEREFSIRSEVEDLLNSRPDYLLSSRIKFYLGTVYFVVLAFLFIKLFF